MSVTLLSCVQPQPTGAGRQQQPGAGAYVRNRRWLGGARVITVGDEKPAKRPESRSGAGAASLTKCRRRASSLLVTVMTKRVPHLQYRRASLVKRWGRRRKKSAVREIMVGKRRVRILPQLVTTISFAARFSKHHAGSG